MASGFVIQSGISSNVAVVDANGSVQATGPLSVNMAGYSVVSSMVTDGVLYPTNAPRLVRRIESTDALRLNASEPSPLVSDNFAGSALDTGVWAQSLATMTATVGGGFANLNAGNSVATTVDAIIKTYKFFPLYEDAETVFRCILQVSAAPQANTTMEWGMFIAATTAAPTDGVLFRINGTGNFLAVSNFNGTEQFVDLGVTAVAATTYRFKIKTTNHSAYYYIGDELVAIIGLATAQATITAACYAPVCFRIYNGGSAPAIANQIKVASCHVTLNDYGGTRDWRSSLVGAGGMGISGQAGATMGSLANWTNSAAPASATLSNIAAGYTTLGGQWQFAAVVSAETDFALFAFTVPAGTAALPGKSFYLTGIRIDGVNTGAAVATSATILQWGVAVGSTAVSLATAEGAGTKIPRRLALGNMAWPIGAAIGAAPTQPAIDHEFTTPLVVNQGEFLHVIVKCFLGTATASQILRGTCAVEGYWE